MKIWRLLLTDRVSVVGDHIGGVKSINECYKSGHLWFRVEYPDGRVTEVNSDYVVLAEKVKDETL